MVKLHTTVYLELSWMTSRSLPALNTLASSPRLQDNWLVSNPTVHKFVRSNSSVIVICYFFGGVFINLVGHGESVSPLWNWEGSRSISCRTHRGFIPLFILSSLAVFLPILSFITFLWSTYHTLGAGYELSLEIQGKPDIFPHSRSFHRRGDKILLPFICWLSFGWCSRRVCWWVNSYRQSPHSAQAILEHTTR